MFTRPAPGGNGGCCPGGGGGKPVDPRNLGSLIGANVAWRTETAK